MGKEDCLSMFPTCTAHCGVCGTALALAGCSVTGVSKGAFWQANVSVLDALAPYIDHNDRRLRLAAGTTTRVRREARLRRFPVPGANVPPTYMHSFKSHRKREANAFVCRQVKHHHRLPITSHTDRNIRVPCRSLSPQHDRPQIPFEHLLSTMPIRKLAVKVVARSGCAG